MVMQNNEIELTAESVINNQISSEKILKICFNYFIIIIDYMKHWGRFVNF